MVDEKSKVICERKGHVAVVTVNNPPMNPLDLEVMNGLQSTFQMLLLEEELRAVILTGTGKAFVAGADIKELKRWTPEASLVLNRKGQQLVDSIENFPVPVIVAINGYALGGGLEIALGCDIRLASEKAKLGLPEARLGIIPGYGGTSRLPKMINIGQAKKMIFSGAHITAQEALQWGLVQEVVAPEALMARAMDLAEEIGRNAPVAVRTVKDAINRCRCYSLAKSLEQELLAAMQCYATQDRTTGIDAFINKEAPVFQNK